MLSSSLFSQNGTVYKQSAVFGTTFQLNQTALNEIGLPALTGKSSTIAQNLRSFPLSTRIKRMGQPNTEPCSTFNSKSDWSLVLTFRIDRLVVLSLIASFSGDHTSYSHLSKLVREPNPTLIGRCVLHLRSSNCCCTHEGAVNRPCKNTRKYHGIGMDAFSCYPSSRVWYSSTRPPKLKLNLNCHFRPDCRS